MALSEEYYDLIMPYVPDEVKSVISNQREIIDKKIDEKVGAFSEELAKEIDKRTREFALVQTNEIRTKLASLRQRVDSMVQNQNADAQTLNTNAEELRTLVESYEDKLEAMGKGIRLAAFNVASNAGLKLPFDKINEFIDGPADTPQSPGDPA